MKGLMALVLAISLLLSYSVIASAEVFKISGETGKIDFDGNYDTLPGDVSSSPNMLTLDGEFNLFVFRVGLEAGFADFDDYKFASTQVRLGWKLGIKTIKVVAFGGYQAYVFTDQSVIDLAHTYSGLVGGAGVEWQLTDMVKVYGTTLIPIDASYSNGSTSGDASLNYLKVGAAFTPLPLVDFFINYRSMGAGSDVVDISSRGYSLGLTVGL